MGNGICWMAPKTIYIAFSEDGIGWSYSSSVIGSATNPIWYPNLISSQGDLTGGKDLGLHYGQDDDKEVQEVESIPVGFERQLVMYSMDFRHQFFSNFT